jgi:hypothetical protein
MVATLIVPEVLVGTAFVELISARESKNEMKEMMKMWKSETFDWTLTHAFYANMEGFVIDFVDAKEVGQGFAQTQSALDDMQIQDNSRERTPSHDREDFKPHFGETRHSKEQEENANINALAKHTSLEEILMSKRPIRYGTLWIYPQTFHLDGDRLGSRDAEQEPPCLNADILSEAIYMCACETIRSRESILYQCSRFGAVCDSLGRFQGSRWALTARQLLVARDYNIIDHIPHVTEDEINHQSKGDFLVKGLAITQSFYLALQLIVRYLNHQPSSQLEIVVVAFAVCALIIYGFLFPKPQDVKTTRYIKALHYLTAEQMLVLAKINHLRTISFHRNAVIRHTKHGATLLWNQGSWHGLPGWHNCWKHNIRVAALAALYCLGLRLSYFDRKSTLENCSHPHHRHSTSVCSILLLCYSDDSRWETQHKY